MSDRVMLLIDADNVSVDVIEQAVALLLDAHGALHVRRAYGTAESVVKCQAVFRRLSVRPMVNLSSGKNSTDIALAVDAIDLVLAERPDIVVIASSDSDFAPLVGRLREKGCRVLGIGQEGKTGDETRKVYDGYTVLAHRRGASEALDAARPTRGPTRQRPPAARKAATKAITAAAPAPAPAPAAATAAAPAAALAPAQAPAAKTAARKTATRRKAGAASSTAAATAAPSAARSAGASSATATASSASPDKLRQIFAELPELLRGEKVELRFAAERLRAAGLLSRSGTCTKLFGQFADRFELTPVRNPNHVRLRDAAEATAV